MNNILGMGQFLKKTVGIYSGALKDIEFRTNVQRNGIYTVIQRNVSKMIKVDNTVYLFFSLLRQIKMVICSDFSTI